MLDRKHTNSSREGEDAPPRVSGPDPGMSCKVPFGGRLTDQEKKELKAKIMARIESEETNAKCDSKRRP